MLLKTMGACGVAAALSAIVGVASAQPLPPPGGGTGAGAAYTVATTGAASVTGTTSETNLAALRIPANTLGKNGAIQINCLWSYTNDANNKSMLARISTTPGATTGSAISAVAVATTTVSSQTLQIIRANNATNSEVSFAATGLTPFTATAAATPIAISADMTVDEYINVNGTLAVGTDTITLSHCFATVFPSKP